MPGTFPVASKILHKYEQDRAYRLHRQKVSTIKPKVATKGPRKYPHLILSLKKIQLEEEKQAEVDHENRLLLHKMTNIMKNRAQVDNWNEYEPRSLNYVARERHIRDIQSENIGIAKRLEKAQPVIKADDLEKDYQHKRYLQTLWNENAKDYEEVTPRHHKFKELKRNKDGIEGEDDYDDDFEDDDSKSKKREKLPPLSIKYSYNPYTNKTSSSNDSLPRIDSKKTEREKLFMYYGDAPPDDKMSSKNSQADSMDDDEVSPTNPTDNDCKQLFKVAKQLAAPPDILIKTLVKKTPKQRQQTKERFKEMYDLELVSELKEGLGPEWHLLIDALLNDSTSSGAKKLHDALEEGDYSQTVEILCSSNKSAMADLKESYKKEYAVSLESDIKDKTDDPEQALLLILQKGLKEDSGKVDEKTAGKDAEQLNETGEGRWSSSSGKFLKLLSTKSLAHLRVVLNLYTVETGGRDATDDIKKECSKNYADAVVTLLQQVRGAETHYADQLFKNMGPTNPVFIDILVNKNEGDMAAIRKEYKKKYDAELPDDVKHKCKGHPTEKVMVELAGKSKGGKSAILIVYTNPQGQKKGSSTAAPPTSKKTGAKKPTEKGAQKGQEGEQKKDNPLSKPTPRVTADAAQQKKDKEKNAEKEKKQKEEEQKNKNGTVQAAAHSDPDDDCLALYDAMKGLGTDEDAIIEIIPHRSNSQRQTLKKKYKEKYKKDLASELQSELTGDFEEIILALMMTPVEYDAYCLHEAMDGMGTTESTLIGIICTRNAKEKQAIKEQYKKAYKKDLEKDVIGDTSGGFTDLLLELLKGEREQGTSVNQKQAQEDAKKLSGNGKEKKIDLDSKEFLEIMTKRNKAQLRATFDEYKKLMGHDIYQGIANSMSGDAEDAYIGLVTVVEDPVGFYADRLSRAFSGVGTNDSMLIRIVVSRSEIDLAEIKVKYKELSGKTLRSSIESECSGDYKKILLEIVGE
ncbi:annexin A6-like isoform X3 [Mytilus californianus]|uniref:annexin A6-like isoform X3 n=1 Tax=Mytilus californianus TaxID=6549 RepID=UPI002247D48F|nr:annexin A6-like isoform X3 [Mytilus californianus]